MSPRTCIECGSQIESDMNQELCADCLLRAGLPEDQEGAFAPTFDSGQVDGAPGPSGDGLSMAELQAMIPQVEFEKLLGRGGMGAVYLAKQRSLDRAVAVKVINQELLSNAVLVDRFAREAKALAKLNHPNIVGIHDFGNVGGVCFLVMEYVDGTDLRNLLASKQVEPAQALNIVPQICGALQYAHDQGIVHRDIKPENILVDRQGQIKIADFGLAKLLSESENQDNLTVTRQVMGTLKYMAPEQMEGAAEIDHRADIYSLGVVFYELLTGDIPLGRFAAPSAKAPVDNRLDDIVMRALEKELPDRYQHASDLQVDVEKVASIHASEGDLSMNPQQGYEGQGYENNPNYADQGYDPQYAGHEYATDAQESLPNASFVGGQPIAPSLPEPQRRLDVAQTHVGIIAILHIIFGALFFIIGIFLFFLLTGIGFLTGDREATTVLSIVGPAVGGLMLLLGLPSFVVGVGLRKYRGWARICALILAIPGLLNVPLGTAISIYTGWALLNDDAAELFRSKRHYEE
ncbi:MAG: serine/threonine-protein kinase [Planctomycetota bacterium]